MNEWITDRLPTEEETRTCYGNVWRGDGMLCHRSDIVLGQPWMPVDRPAPYVKPKRFEVTCNSDGATWFVFDTLTHNEVSDNIPTREAAERIADIYNEVMP
jgi:hypothetical protein